MVSYNCTKYHRSNSISIVFFSLLDKIHHSVEEYIPSAPLLLFTEAGTVANLYGTPITELVLYMPFPLPQNKLGSSLPSFP